MSLWTTTSRSGRSIPMPNAFVAHTTVSDPSENASCTRVRSCSLSPAWYAAAALPAHLPVPPPWSALPALLAQPGFLREEARPDALNVAQDFATWSGERHRADA